MRHLMGLVLAVVLVVGTAGNSEAQVSVSIGNPYTGQGLFIGSGYGVGLGSPGYGVGYPGYGVGVAPGYGLGYPSYGVGYNNFYSPAYGYRGFGYSSGYRGVAAPIGGYGYGYGYGRPYYGGYGYRGARPFGRFYR